MVVGQRIVQGYDSVLSCLHSFLSGNWQEYVLDKVFSTIDDLVRVCAKSVCLTPGISSFVSGEMRTAFYNKQGNLDGRPPVLAIEPETYWNCSYADTAAF